MIIPVRTEADFQQLMDALTDELVTAAIHLKLYKDLMDAYNASGIEFQQAWTFWSLTIAAHLDACVFRLCKVYDQYGGGRPSVNLPNFLDTVAANVSFFSEANFRRRLQGNPYVDSLAAIPRQPDPNRLKADQDAVSNSNPLVRNFTVWRNNFYAHRSSSWALDPESFNSKYSLTLSDVEALLDKGLEIVNYYSDLFRAVRHSKSIIGRSDYRSVLEAVRAAYDRHAAEVAECIGRVKVR